MKSKKEIYRWIIWAAVFLAVILVGTDLNQLKYTATYLITLIGSCFAVVLLLRALED